MTEEEVIAQIDKKLTGAFICNNIDDVKLITDVLRRLGYRWEMLYSNDGRIAQIIYRFDPR